MSTYNQLIHKYKKQFELKGLSPEMVKAFILELCNEEKVNLYYDIDKQALPSIEDQFEKGIIRMLNDEPMNYVLGYSYFYGYQFKVNKDVLIPRPETEELVGLILSKYDEFYKGQNVNICDVGTGSGAIAISLKKEEEKLNVFASDISIDALNVAKENADNLNANIQFLCGSMLEPYIENNIKVDILVSNPPYIRNDEKLETSVIDYEPHVALFGGDDGLKFYKEIFTLSNKVLNENGLIFFEMGYDQAENMSKLAHSYYPKGKVEIYKDINGKDRMFLLKL